LAPSVKSDAGTLALNRMPVNTIGIVRMPTR
jgi:hypothetical protein